MSDQDRRLRARQLRFAWAIMASVSVACGGVAREQHPPSAAQAGAPAADAGLVDAAVEENDAASVPDASSDNDAAAAEACPSDTVSCCDKWTGVSSLPICVDGYTQCEKGLELQLVERACQRTPEACRVASSKELDGKACSSVAATCLFGGGCSSCHCECQESTLLWHCECTPC